jgi:hypothetical protein
MKATVSDPKEEALKFFVQPIPAPMISEYEAERRAQLANRERLKAERLAREARSSA